MSAAPPRASLLLGIVRVACGRADGLAQFKDTRQAFLSSLLPLVAFPIIAETLVAVSGNGEGSLSDLLATICALLAPPVISHYLAQRWGRQALWPRFATAFNWCQWVIPAVGCLLLVLVSVLIASGLPNDFAAQLWILGLAGYALWLHWFLARRALDLGRLRAFWLVLIVNFVTVCLVVGPLLIAHLAAPAEANG